ncbi:hypothetical protein H4S14_002769 [Agrobacterium vitis]|nr:hypothetical protein [Agrobacterium vitis]MBE1439009.1 hypothetical protein [Agrobacterium vitis]
MVLTKLVKIAVRMMAIFVVGATGMSVAMAQEARPLKGVVELFTSQGCVSCPPADRAFERLANQPDVVALAYHVDYWNYRGWTDTLGSADNTARQYAYARSFGRSGVYTPQAVLNGRVQMKGTDSQALSGKMESLKTSGDGLTVKVNAAIRGDELAVNIGSGEGQADVVVVYFKQRKDVDVLKGENKGQRITYLNSVTDIQSVGMWRGNDMTISLPSKVLRNDGCDGFAVLLQASTPAGDPGKIMGATMVLVPSAAHVQPVSAP